jgi:phospholipase A1
MSILSLASFAILAVIWPCGSASAEEGADTTIRLEPYKPLYFLVGQPNTKIQLSFKGRLVEGSNLYFGYTQLMMWELIRSDPYFSDLNYAPEIFYRYHVADSPKRWIDFGAWEHESNGKGGANERSWNRTYLRYHDETDLGWKQTRLLWSIKAWVPYAYNSANKNITEYRGLWEVNVTLAKLPSPVFEQDEWTFRLYPGGPSSNNPLRGGQELTLRAKLRGRRFLPLFVGQVFHGFGENLLDFQESRWGLRAGIGF